jgi:3beta-hydroxy-Delta5-steroid dehydrogenase / steroid Delta-isomerase
VPGGAAPGQAYFINDGERVNMFASGAVWPGHRWNRLGWNAFYLDNYFSTAKAERDLGYRPMFTTEQAMADCLPYYTELCARMKAAPALA